MTVSKQEPYLMKDDLEENLLPNRSVFKNEENVDNLNGIAKRVSQITISAIKQMPLLANELGGCVSLGQGIPSVTHNFV